MNPPKLKAVYRLDSIPLSATYWTKEGYLKDEPIVTSVGIFEYLNQDGSKRRELRLPEEVFDPASLASYEGKPIIITHNAGEVDKNNVQREHIGTILSPGIQDGNDVRAKIVIHNTDAMKRSGMRELSLGYSLDLDERPGTWNGQPYDAIQRNIRINHLALVQNARAGDQARLNIDSRDTTKGVKVMANTRKDGGPLTPEEMEKAIAEFKARKAARSGAGAPAADGGEGNPPAAPATDGDPGATPPPAKQDEGSDPMQKVQAVKDRRDRRDMDGDPTDQQGAMATIAQMDEDLCTLLDVIDTLTAQKDFAGDSGSGCEGNQDGDEPPAKEDGDDEGKSMNADSVDALVRERVSLVRMGEKLNLDGLEDMSITDARKAIIKAVKPGMRLDGKSPAYIKAAFDLAKDTMNARKDTNYQRAQMMNGTRRADSASPRTTGAKAARQRMMDRMENGGNQ